MIKTTLVYIADVLITTILFIRLVSTVVISVTFPVDVDAFSIRTSELSYCIAVALCCIKKNTRKLGDSDGNSDHICTVRMRRETMPRDENDDGDKIIMEMERRMTTRKTNKARV